MAFSEAQARAPKGSPVGGQWIKMGVDPAYAKTLKAWAHGEALAIASAEMHPPPDRAILKLIAELPDDSPLFALAKHIESKSDRAAMLTVLESSAEWQRDWAGATKEWQAAQEQGAHPGTPKVTARAAVSKTEQKAAAEVAEHTKQAALAAAQTNPLAHPRFVLGMPGFRDPTPYIAAYGQEFTPAALPANMTYGRMGECYKNASLLVVEHPELTYAEGFAKKGDFTYMHGWAVTADGTVVDPTWKYSEDTQYFGVKYDRAAYLQSLYKNKFYGVLGGTDKSVAAALDTGLPHLRWDPAKHPRDARGRFIESHAAALAKPTAAFTPSNPDGLDTQARFSESKGRYTAERRALHEAIIAKYIADTTPVPKPTAMVLGGGMGAGKSTLVSSAGLAKGNTVEVNVDLIRSDLPEVKDMIAAGQKMNVSYAHEEASDIGKQLMTEALKSSRNMTLDGTGDTTLEKLGAKLRLMRATGHEVVAEYVTVPTAMAQARADRRAEKTDRRFIPPAAMQAVHVEVSRIFPKAVDAGLYDRARLWDTRGALGTPPKLIMSADGQTVTVHDQVLYDEFLAKGQDVIDRGPSI